MIQPLPWDSGFFGRRIATTNSPDVQEALAQAKWAFIQELYVFSEKPIDELKWSGREIRNYYEADKCNFTADGEFRRATTEDLPFMYRLALGFTGESRFRENPLVYEYYKRSCDREIKEFCLIVELFGLPAGFISVNPRGRIGLIAVDPYLQRKGLGKQLIAKVFEVGFGTITVETQSTNLSACKLYEACGFKLVRQEWIYHVKI